MKRKNIKTLLPEVNENQYQLLIDWVAGEIIGLDSTCEKNHPKYYDWCSYCNQEQIRSGLRREQREKLNVLLGGTL